MTKAVDSLDELLQIDCRKLPELFIVEAPFLPDQPVTYPWSEKRHWTKRLVLCKRGDVPANSDVAFAARGGGHWVRLRDIA